MQTDAREAFDVSLEKPETIAKYGDNPQGRQMLIARRLLERDVRFVQVWQGGWDLHSGIAQRAQRNADQLDPAIGAIIFMIQTSYISPLSCLGVFQSHHQVKI